MKKIVFFSIIGVLISALVFGGVAYFMVFSKGAEKKKEIINYEVGEFSTNLSDTRHFFKGKITIGITNKKELKTLDESKVALRDGILSILIQQKPEDMVSAAGMDAIKEELKKNIGENVDIQSIEEIYFTDYIVQ
ncbi:flagellar FliL protein [Peptoclostridium litorale DSM 5388]|uniref:Flagellar protein FliL n=1 Tax=Peptoclostridium litorale DSM 5388 TaxID=1121324 RepID=A0A069RDS3_PEPLI|nr:flagellar basal body-associated FliL family protein [Peptoclostridium litorale]KDR95171.1 hypothetical protein CLIT_11c02000 [Peptoclostridium litorale DSM 5388]SIN73883.1 flagellar FliL protein [Peptoclostridium litorale DSM 5388]